MREIVFDTETTGLDPFTGDKIVEIGAVELVDHMPTGNKYHQYINPMRSMSEEVIRVHGLTEEFLSDKPTFEEICDDFMAFVGSDSSLVAHNATFDMKFLNYQLNEVNRPQVDMSRVIDTLILAKKKFPGSRVNLDELCKRFHVDNSARTVHGALLDAELLAEVYLELLGGHEPGFLLAQDKKEQPVVVQALAPVEHVFHEARHLADVSQEEAANHQQWIDKIKNSLWTMSDEMAENK